MNNKLLPQQILETMLTGIELSRKEKNVRKANHCMMKYVYGMYKYLDNNADLLPLFVDICFTSTDSQARIFGMMLGLSYGISINDAIVEMKFAINRYETKKQGFHEYMAANAMKMGIDKKGIYPLFPKQKHFAKYDKDWFTKKWE